MNSLRPVLLVEDDSVDIMTLKRCFKQLKIPNELWIARNGEEALQLLRSPNKKKPCIVLLDINMPKMNDLEFLEQFKQNFLIITDSVDGKRIKKLADCL